MWTGRGGGGRAVRWWQGGPLVAGRLSRPDPDKFPPDFPRSYEGLLARGRDVRFRVMAWSPEVAARYAGHEFDARWDLLPARAEPSVKFLGSLDLFVYALGAKFAESWGRSTVEAMLTGAVPLISGGKEGLRHHLRHLVPHGTAGFHCEGRRGFAAAARELADDAALRSRMSRAAADYARDVLCDAKKHRQLWRSLLEA